MPSSQLLVLGTALAISVCPVDLAAQERPWGHYSDDGMFIADTANSAGDQLAQYCFLETGDCVYAVSLPVTCRVNDSYRGLVNADSGSFVIDLTCISSNRAENIYLIGPFDEMDGAVRRSVELGIAVGLQSGRFQVVRFGLRGSSAAINAMRSAAEAALRRTPTNRSTPVREKI